MKITSIHPFSIAEDRDSKVSPRQKPQVAPPTEAVLDPLKKDLSERKVVDIIEEAQKRAKKKQASRDKNRKKGLATYTKVGFGKATLHEKGKKLDTRA